jgi:hypothetical protein
MGIQSLHPGAFSTKIGSTSIGASGSGDIWCMARQDIATCTHAHLAAGARLLESISWPSDITKGICIIVIIIMALEGPPLTRAESLFDRPVPPRTRTFHTKAGCPIQDGAPHPWGERSKACTASHRVIGQGAACQGALYPYLTNAAYGSAWTAVPSGDA